jgi:8-oxo-dGTP diphosphatase
VEPLLVVAAVIERDGKVLITRRRSGTHLAGLWEFPGGKSTEGEGHAEALRREIREELGALVSVGELLDAVEWQYPDKRVRLLFFRCELHGEAQPLEGQEMAWVASADLSSYEFPPADTALIARLARGRPSGGDPPPR